MRALVIVHRWLGVFFCLLFAMWFATGMVMHFVPFPALTEAERVAGLAPIDATSVRRGPDEAASAAHVGAIDRMRLIARPDGGVYVVHGASGVVALRARDLAPAPLESPELAVAIAVEHARNRGLARASAQLVELASHDQWSVSNGLDVHRPLYRIALGDEARTELYVSSRTGEVVRDTTAFERAWNYAGSVTHWIYPTALRRNWRAWDATVWWLSLAAAIGAFTGALLGLLRLGVAAGGLATPFTGWHAWHHGLGLASMVFVLTWITSGWLSMDHARLFSTGAPTIAEASAFAGTAAWSEPALREPAARADGIREVEWFVFGARLYRRERVGLSSQRIGVESADSASAFLLREEVTQAARRLSSRCGAAHAVNANDAYPVRSTMPRAPVFRVVCGDAWFHVDAADGRLLEKLDRSRRAYRWLYSALHTLDFPALASRPAARTSLVIALCALGLVFSLTAVVIGWKRVSK